MTQHVDRADEGTSFNQTIRQDNRPGRAGIHPAATDALFFEDQMFHMLDSYRKWPGKRASRASEPTGS